jgi:gluconate kinase
MTKEELLIKIEREEPQIIYFSGKTSTGKSTFVKNLNSNSKFTVIELDKIVEKEIISKFNLNHNDAFLDVYGNEKSDYLEIFSSAVQSEIRSKLRFSAVIVEGAIAKSGILQKIFSGNLENFLFVYFHPINLESYIQRIHARLVEGIISGNSRLPKPNKTEPEPKPELRSKNHDRNYQPRSPGRLHRLPELPGCRWQC